MLYAYITLIESRIKVYLVNYSPMKHLTFEINELFFKFIMKYI